MWEWSPPGISHTDLEQTQGILKGESGLFFDPCVNAMAWRPYYLSCMEASYCTFGFGVICAHYHYRMIHRAITNMLAWFESTREGNSCLMKLFGGLSYEKISRYNNSPPYVMARWSPQQIPTLNFLEQTWKRVSKTWGGFPGPGMGWRTVTGTRVTSGAHHCKFPKIEMCKCLWMFSFFSLSKALRLYVIWGWGGGWFKWIPLNKYSTEGTHH